tara:strand:- start:1148 stop:2047 length:900 start_codon:yes stop_codon:yes gene_type:complete
MLLDRDGMPTATLAYSLRKLREDYTGKSVRVRRASDSVEVDVDFDDENKVSGSSVITVTSGSYSGAMTLAAFSSGTTIHVTTWWDQVGTAQSAYQTTAGSQPVLASDYSTLEFSASYGNYLQTTHVPAEGGDGTDVGDSNTWMTVSKYIDTDNDRHELVSALYYYPAYGRSLYVEADVYKFDVGGGGGNTDIDTLNSSTTASTSDIEVVIASYMPAEPGNEMQIKVNGSDKSPASSSHNVNSFSYGHFHIGYCNYPYFTTDKWDGKIYEVVAWENTAAFNASSATAGTVWEDAEAYYDL